MEERTPHPLANDERHEEVYIDWQHCQLCQEFIRDTVVKVQGNINSSPLLGVGRQVLGEPGVVGLAVF